MMDVAHAIIQDEGTSWGIRARGFCQARGFPLHFSLIQLLIIDCCDMHVLSVRK